MLRTARSRADAPWASRRAPGAPGGAGASRRDLAADGGRLEVARREPVEPARAAERVYCGVVVAGGEGVAHVGQHGAQLLEQGLAPAACQAQRVDGEEDEPDHEAAAPPHSASRRVRA
jgi:hypothetical protein